MNIQNPHDRAYAKVEDVPTDVLASRFVGSLILAKGNLAKYEALTAQLIRKLRGEPDPVVNDQQKAKTEDGK